MLQPRIEAAACGHPIERHILGGDADGAGGGDTRLLGRLARHPQIEPPVLEPRSSAGRLDRDGIGRFNLVAPPDIHLCERRAAEAGFGNGMGLAAIQHRIELGGDLVAANRRGGGPFGLHRFERAFRTPPRIGGDREPALAFDNPGQPADAGRAVAVEPGELGAVGRPVADRGEHHARQPHVAGKAVRAIDFGGQIKPRKGWGFLGIGAERFFARRLGAQRRGVGGRVTCRRLGQFAKACALGGVSDKSALDLAFLVRNPPARGGFLRQHRARGGSGFAAGLFVGGKRCAIGGRSEALRAGKALGHQRIGAR